MINQLVQLVMPKQLGFLGAALAIGSTALSFIESKKQEREINDAQNRSRASSRLIRQEQAGRARRAQIRDSQVAQAQSEATAVAGGNAPSSGSVNAVSGVQSSTAENLGNINTGLATGNINAILSEQVKNAGRPSDFALFNNAFVQPFAQQAISNSISNAFKPDTPAPTT